MPNLDPALYTSRDGFARDGARVFRRSWQLLGPASLVAGAKVVAVRGRDDTIARNLDVVQEDFEICIETHQNHASGGYKPSPLSPRHEQGVAWFQARIAQALAK